MKHLTCFNMPFEPGNKLSAGRPPGTKSTLKVLFERELLADFEANGAEAIGTDEEGQKTLPPTQGAGAGKAISLKKFCGHDWSLGRGYSQIN